MKLNEQKRQTLKKQKKLQRTRTEKFCTEKSGVCTQTGEKQHEGLSEPVGDWDSWVYI